MSKYKKHVDMILAVAQAIGEDMRRQVAFVGGCTTGLLLTDDYTREQVRHTEDVDLIVHVVGQMGWADLQATLRARGFKDIMADDQSPICAMALGELRVDFMPDDPAILGFSNRWYRQALDTAQDFPLTGEVSIRLLTPTYFVATKLEAYRGRGNNDPLSSQDIEDILNLFAGRHTLTEEIDAAPQEVKSYIAEQLGALLDDGDFDYAVQAAALGDASREDWIYGRLKLAIKQGMADAG